LSALAILIFAPAAEAQVIVGGNSEARTCYMRAKTDQAGHYASIKTCENALTNISLNQKDLAATHVNLGILLMRRGDYEKSLRAYERAAELRPELAETHINRGACLIFLSRPEEAVDALSESIDLGTDNLPEALYNRAIAYERLGQVKEAYFDFKKAQELRPDWELPGRALERYQVTSKKR